MQKSFTYTLRATAARHCCKGIRMSLQIASTPITTQFTSSALTAPVTPTATDSPHPAMRFAEALAGVLTGSPLPVAREISRLLTPSRNSNTATAPEANADRTIPESLKHVTWETFLLPERMDGARVPVGFAPDYMKYHLAFSLEALPKDSHGMVKLSGTPADLARQLIGFLKMEGGHDANPSHVNDPIVEKVATIFDSTPRDKAGMVSLSGTPKDLARDVALLIRSTDGRLASEANSKCVQTMVQDLKDKGLYEKAIDKVQEWLATSGTTIVHGKHVDQTTRQYAETDFLGKLALFADTRAGNRPGSRIEEFVKPRLGFATDDAYRDFLERTSRPAISGIRQTLIEASRDDVKEMFSLYKQWAERRGAETYEKH